MEMRRNSRIVREFLIMPTEVFVFITPQADINLQGRTCPSAGPAYA